MPTEVAPGRPRSAVAVASALFSILLTVEPAAPEPSGRTIEEIIVTAQKREERIRDVPFSLSVVEGEKLRDANVDSMNDVSLFTPNVKLQITQNSQFINIRGLGTGENRGFEQSVGVVIDGVYYGRPDYLLGGLFDLDRIEVLRGPQGTIFGKNTTAGALNITTALPQEELSAEAAALYGEFDQWRARGVLTGPVSAANHLSARLAFSRGKRDGYIFNNHPGKFQVDDDDTMLRAKLRWLPTDGVDVVLGYDRSEVSQIGDGYQLSRARALSLAFYRQFDPATETDPENFFTTTDDERAGGARTINSGTLNASWKLGGFELKGITGVSDLAVVQIADADFSSAPLLGLLDTDDYRQFSQELRLLSPPGKIEYLAGLYYFQSDFVVRTTYDLAKDGDAPLVAGAAGLPPGLRDPVIDVLDTLLSGGGVIRDQSNKHFDQDAQAYAAFGQATWHAIGGLSLIGGLRYGRETKKVDMRNEFLRTGVLFQALLEEQEYDVHDERAESDFSPKVSLKYDLTEDATLYATWAKGFKSGGFNQLAPTARDVSFGPEKASTLEAGAKMRLFDGALQANVGYFHTRFDGLQVTIFNGTQFVVGNAARAVTQGVEADGIWLPFESLTLTISGGFTRARYQDYRDGPCWADGNGMAGPNPRERDVNGNCLQDLSGETLHRAPELNAAFGVAFRWPLPPLGLELVTGVDVLYQDATFLNLDLDPVDFQDAYTQLNGRIGVQASDERWSLTVFGRNLSDEVVILEAADVPIFEGDHFSRQDLPRTLGGELRIRF